MELKTNSQAHQDIFAALILRKTNGYFLDIGCSEPIGHNNTFLLESQLNFNGILIDYEKEKIDWCQKVRSPLNKYLCIDLRNKPISEILEENKAPSVIDYVSFDADTVDILLARTFPFSKYEIGCFTFEHDAYTQGSAVRDESREIFKKNGYSIVFGDIDYDHGYFEDWYINNKLAGHLRLFKPIAEKIHHRNAIGLLNNILQ